MAIVKKMTKRGFTLIELMIVVVIIGVLAALAIYGVQKYVANSKSAEARMMLGRMSKDHLAVFEGENQAYSILSFGQAAAVSRSLCPTAAGMLGAMGIGTIPGGEKVQPTPSAFRDNAGWQCMGFTITTPVYYNYSMTSAGGSDLDNMIGASSGDAFTAFAYGNLDNDGNTSRFELGGIVRDGSSGDLVLVLATSVNEDNPEE